MPSVPRQLVRGEPLVYLKERYRDFRAYRITDDLWLANLPFRRRHIEALKAAGARTVINLVEDDEYLTFRTRPSQRQELEAAYSDFGLFEYRLPMPDKSSHLPATFDAVVACFKAAVADQRTPVVIHCRGGKERSSTALGAILVDHLGLEPKAALGLIRGVYPNAVPLRGQREALRRWAAGRKA